MLNKFRQWMIKFLQFGADDSAGAAGRFKLIAIKPDGTTRWETAWSKNLTTTLGKARIANLMGNAAALPFLYLEVGTSATAPSAGQTALGAPISTGGIARALAAFSNVTIGSANDTAQWTYTWNAITLPFTVAEIGYFDTAVTGGVMGGRGLPIGGSKAVVAGDQLVALYQVQIT